MNAGKRDENISSLLTERIKAGDFPSAVYVVAEGGRLKLADALGDAVREPEQHATTFETIYDLASLTKPLVTGLLCAEFLERGELRLNDAVADYLPEFGRADKHAIMVRHLLTHTSGLPAWQPLYIATKGKRERTLEVIAGEALVCTPGTQVIYSDLGFIALGILIERIAGKRLSTIAHHEIFEPLRLQRTFFNPAKTVQTEVAACESTGNTYEREMCRDDPRAREFLAWRQHLIWGEVHDGNAHFLGGEAGHAGLFSTARETLRLAEQFIAGRTQLLAPNICDLFRTNMTEGLNEARSCAWQLAATKDSTAGPDLPPDSFGHVGFTGTSCWIDAARERVFILLTNRTHARKLPFVNINSVRRRFHTLAVAALDER